MTIVEAPRAVTGGVDTHLDLNVAAALDDIGGLLGVEEFATDAGGCCPPPSMNTVATPSVETAAGRG